MTWQPLLDDRSVRPHATSLAEVQGLRGVVERDLADASLASLSADRRFATAYNAALQSAKLAIACAGYRVDPGGGHHLVTFKAVTIAMGPKTKAAASYFDLCRRKRNMLDYDLANVATETEAAEILEKAREFRDAVEGWIAADHPQYKAKS